MKKAILATCAAVSLSLSVISCSEAETPIINGIETDCNQYGTWFCITPAELVEKINSQSNGNFPEIYLIPGHDGDRLWTIGDDPYGNGELLKLTIRTDTSSKGHEDMVRELKLDLYAHNEEDAKINGYMIEAIIETFTPGSVSMVTYGLNVYGENSNIGPEYTKIYGEYGNTEYSFYPDDSFVVRPVEMEYQEESSTTVIKPT